MEMFVIEKSELFKEIDRLILAVKAKNESNWMTKSELAKYLKVSLTTIDNWRNNPRFAENPFPVCWAGEKPRFHKSQVDEWMIKNGELANGKS